MPCSLSCIVSKGVTSCIAARDGCGALQWFGGQSEVLRGWRMLLNSCTKTFPV